MPIPLFTNNAATALAVAITPTDTVLQVVAGTGQQFPSPTGGNYFMLTLVQINNPEVSEIVKCINRTGDYLTVERGQENTQPQIFNISDNVQLRITAQSLNLFAQGGGGGGGGTAATQVAEFTATQGQTVFNIPFSYVPDNYNLAVFVNGSKQIIDVNYSESSSTSITFFTGLNVGDLVEVVYNLPIAAGQIDASNILYDQGGVGAVESTVQKKLEESVSVKDFGAVGDGVTDDTTAIQNAINYCITNNIQELIISYGTYKVTSIVINNANGLHINGSGTLFGALTGSYEAVLVIKNSNDIVIDGKLNVFASYNTGYTCGVTLYTDNATQCTNIDLNNIRVIGAELAWRIGKPGTYGSLGGTSGPLVAEITISGGETYGCPKAIQVYGTQTFVNFVGVRISADDQGGDSVTPGWSTLPKGVLQCFGGTAIITGGEFLLTQSQSFFGVNLQPIVDSVFGNQYGSAYISNVEMEVASQYLQIQNSNSVPTPTAGLGVASFSQCAGYCANGSNPAMQVYDSTFSGRILVSNSPWFSNVPNNPDVRTGLNITSSSNLCDIYVDDSSFGYGFKQGIQGISGGNLHFSYRCILRAENCNSQSLPVNTATGLIFTSLNNSDPDTIRFNNSYSTSTGLFTTPAGGLKSINVGYNIVTTQPTQSGEAGLYVNGSLYQSSPTFVASSAGTTFAGTFDIPSLNAGDTLQIKVTQLGTSSTTNGGSYDHMTIYAKN